MKPHAPTHANVTNSVRPAESDTRRAAVCFGFVALIGAATMFALWLLALVLGFGAGFVEYHHAIGLVSLLAGLSGGSAWYERWERMH